MEAGAALTEHERDIVDGATKFAATALDQAANEELNELKIEARCCSAIGHSNCYIRRRLMAFLVSKTWDYVETIFKLDENVE